jgi:hypothetical protein
MGDGVVRESACMIPLALPVSHSILKYGAEVAECAGAGTCACLCAEEVDSRESIRSLNLIRVNYSKYPRMVTVLTVLPWQNLSRCTMWYTYNGHVDMTLLFAMSSGRG